MKKKSFLNRYFSQVFVISLFDKIDKYKKVKAQFKKRGISVRRFVAIDGRCKGQKKQGCLDKLKSFEMAYNVRIPIPKHKKLIEIVPYASLTIGTIILLREMVKRKWKRILICEDDIEIQRNFKKRFMQGIKEIGNTKWDVLYLGCGDECGIKGISSSPTAKNRHHTYYNQYSIHKNDLRLECDNCEELSEHITRTYRAGGTWCYAYSLSGAKKVLKMLDNNANNHIDQLLINMMYKKQIKALAFDPPLVMHEDISNRHATTTIPWGV